LVTTSFLAWKARIPAPRVGLASGGLGNCKKRKEEEKEGKKEGGRKG
jgi:hypothetical protein